MGRCRRLQLEGRGTDVSRAAGWSSALYDEASLFEERPHTFAEVALKLDAVWSGRPTGAARAFQFLRQSLEPFGRLFQTVDDGDGLTAAAALLEPQLRDDFRVAGVLLGAGA